MYAGLNYEIHSSISTNESDILKTKGKLKIMRDIVENDVMHTMTSRIVKF